MKHSGWAGAVGPAVCAVGLLFARPVEARPARQLAEGEPATSRVIQLGLGGEYGVKLAGPALNPWGYGLGVHLGYTLPMGVYLGLPFDYFFGTKEDSGNVGFASELKLWQVGVEGGYDLALSDTMVLRAKAGVGLALVTDAHCDGDVCSKGSGSELVLGPGLSFLYLGPGFSFTLDARYELLPVDPLAHGLIFSIGVGF